MLSLDLTGRLALVTGATGDLGREIATALAQCGAQVALHYHRNAAYAEELLRQIPSAKAFQADITDEHTVRHLAGAVREKMGVPDVIVANAVIQYDWKPILEQAAADFESQFRSCVLQSVFLAQSFFPALIAEIEAGRRRDGRFIAINTECAVQCFENQGAYVAGKRGLDGLCRVLAKEVGPKGIRVNQVAPGWMISERDRAKGTERAPEYEARIPLRRRGTDRDIAEAVAFLASDRAAYISGAFLPVCGANVIPAI